MDVLDIRSLSKSYPGQKALDSAHLTVRAGQIHALLGQNGSGKSTLIKILAGFHKPDPGADVDLFGGTSHYDGSGTIDQDRVRVMHQDLGLVGSLNVMENLALGRGFSSQQLGRIRWAAERRRARDLLHQFGVDLDPRRRVSDLAPAEASVVGLARAMQDWDPQGGLLVLDEPTATLPGPEVARLFDAVRRVAARGAGILFVTHRLDEVFELGDWVTVLRDGRTVASRSLDGLDTDALVELIVGRPVGELYAEPPEVQADTVMRAEKVWGTVVEDFDLALNRGEIVGVAGIVGSGREEIGSLLGGIARRAGGSLRVDDVGVRGEPAESLRAGLAYVPADRKNLGSVQTESVGENIVLGRMRSLYRAGWLGSRAQRADALEWIEKVDVRPGDPDKPMSTLSGGNQQKTVIARVLRVRPKAIVLDEPTQGVDVGAKATIYDLLAGAAREGAGVVVCSSDAEELANICDRVLVLRHGRLAAELHKNRLTVDAIVEQTLR
ncbi:sugar ABC transporter ATP-binding protein [Jatrophihabitans sp. YIM 134969]